MQSGLDAICATATSVDFIWLGVSTSAAAPAPRAFTFGIPSQGADHGVGVCFLLMEELLGKPWDGQGDTAKVWNGLANIFAELEKHPFPKTGSLSVESPDDLPSVSAMASDRFVCLDPCGPFETPAAYYAGWAEQYLALIADGQLYPQFPVEVYLVYRFLQDNAAQLSDTEDKFFLKHVDDKGDHLLVDGGLNLTGIIHRLADGACRSAAGGICFIPRVGGHGNSLRRSRLA